MPGKGQKLLPGIACLEPETLIPRLAAKLIIRYAQRWHELPINGFAAGGEAPCKDYVEGYAQHRHMSHDAPERTCYDIRSKQRTILHEHQVKVLQCLVGIPISLSKHMHCSDQHAFADKLSNQNLVGTLHHFSIKALKITDSAA